MDTLELILKEGPVLIPSLAGSGVAGTYPLWDDISASEFFPAGVQSAYYVLSLRRGVRHADEVFGVETALVSALHLLASAWPFSGGSFMVLDTRGIVVSPRFESNAHRLHSELLARRGQSSVAASATMLYQTLATYGAPPLESASFVARAALADHGLRRLLEYHQAAWVAYYGRGRIDLSSWFIDLYKVRDLLAKLHSDEETAKSRLAIPDVDWSFFGRILNNNDLRHAEVAGVVPSVDREDVRRLYDLARRWTLSHLRTLGLPVR